MTQNQHTPELPALDDVPLNADELAGDEVAPDYDDLEDLDDVDDADEEDGR